MTKFRFREKVSMPQLRRVLGRSARLFYLFRNTHDLKEYTGKAKLAMQMLRDYKNGTYRDVSYKVISAFVIGLAYVLMPADSIPDMIPGIGFIDDASVIAYLVARFDSELEKYSNFIDAAKEVESEEAP
jgi:uncharacterized membrane protein YkvA (DUF1232 family)